MSRGVLRFALHRILTGVFGGILLVGLGELAGPYLVDPAALLLGDSVGETDIERIRHDLGLDRPWYIRVPAGMLALARVAEERSYRHSIPVAVLIAERWRTSVSIMGWTVLVATVLGVVVGTGAALSEPIRRLVLLPWSLLLALPAFVTASLIASHPSMVTLPLPGELLAGFLMGSYGGLWYAHIVYRCIRSEINSWHIRALQAFGFPQAYLVRSTAAAVTHHALGAFDLLAAVLLTGGTVIVEYSFHLEGLGLLLLDSILAMDLPVVRTLLAELRAVIDSRFSVARHARPQNMARSAMSRAHQNPVLLSARGIRTNVRKERGSWHEVISGVGIDIGRAEIMGLIGESGAGKSMLAHSLIRIPPSAQVLFSAGEVWFDGRDLCRLSEPDLRVIRGHHLTMMFQDAAKCLHPRMRCGAQLAAVYQRYAKGREGQAGESIARLGLDPGQILPRYPHEVFGGMKQLVYLAMALACPASLLILDEPTTALDAVTRQQVLNVLRARRETRGTALLVITHDLTLASLVADRLLVMYAGTLIESLPASAH